MKANENRERITKADKFREISTAEINTKIDELKSELFNLRFQLATGQLENTARIKHLKKDIARMKTIIRERELGIEYKSDK